MIPAITANRVPGLVCRDWNMTARFLPVMLKILECGPDRGVVLVVMLFVKQLGM